jgi:signal peptidase I
MMYLSRVGYVFWTQPSCRGVAAIALSGLLGIAAGHFVGTVGGTVSVVEGSSMAPTFEPGARVFTDPVSGELGRGDVVLLEDGKGGCAVKRLIGLPHETITLWRGYVFIDRKMLREPYLPKYTFTDPDENSGSIVFELGPDQYFVLGDNRVGSIDSRSYGPIGLKQIKSKVRLPDNTLRARFAAYTLPDWGKRTIRPINAEARLSQF